MMRASGFPLLVLQTLGHEARADKLCPNGLRSAVRKLLYRHRPSIRIAAAFTALVMLSGFTTGRATFPEPSPGFVPKETYGLNTISAWSIVVRALNANRIPIDGEWKRRGKITTDYIEGPNRGVMPRSDNVRYRYTIFISPRGVSRTNILIMCAIEGSQYDADGPTPFREITAANSLLSMNLVNWLHEKIEKQILY